MNTYTVIIQRNVITVETLSLQIEADSDEEAWKHGYALVDQFEHEGAPPGFTPTGEKEIGDFYLEMVKSHQEGVDPYPFPTAYNMPEYPGTTCELAGKVGP